MKSYWAEGQQVSNIKMMLLRSIYFSSTVKNRDFKLNCCAIDDCQDSFHAVRPEDLRHSVTNNFTSYVWLHDCPGVPLLQRTYHTVR